MHNPADLYTDEAEEFEVADEFSEDETLDDADDGTFDPSKRYTKKELEEMADVLLRNDADRELCRQCRTADPEFLPYGNETGEIEWQIQLDKETRLPLLDDEGNALYVAFPELQCDKGHRWYKGEGPRRDIRGKNPILFETHLYNRKRREIYVKDGIPDPAFTMDRWGKRPTPGIYNRSHPLGRKVNTPEQRAKNGASWYRALMPLPLLFLHITLIMIVILSIGVIAGWLWNQSKNEELSMRHICVNTMPILNDERLNVNEIDTMHLRIVRLLRNVQGMLIMLITRSS